jgi:cytochrome c-type biogenesis protein CcmH
LIVAFWIIASLLAIGVLLLVLPPLLRSGARATGPSRDAMNAAVYREQLRELEEDVAVGTMSPAGYEEARREIEHRVLEEVGGTDASAPSGNPAPVTAIAIGVALPIIAFALYFTVGNLPALLPGGAGMSAQAPHGAEVEEIRAMVKRLAARMQENPDNVEGWVMLARSYRALEQFAEAAQAYGNAVARAGEDAALLADYADALAMAQGRRLQGEPEKIIQRALAIDPNNVKALALAGTAAFERRDFAGAAEYWERILRLVPDDSGVAQAVRGSIAEARELAAVRPGGAGPVARAPDSPAPTAPSVGGTVSGVVKLAPALAGRVAPEDTLFVFARPAEGPRMPIAIVRARVKDLPLKFTLDDSMAMTPQMALSGQERVIVGARVSKTGDATPRPGDLEGYSAPVAVGASDITVLIEAEAR